MLAELNVSHFAIIDNIRITFKNGLNIISGETGAGKSVILKSLGLLMGEKSSAESVKPGHEQAVIEGLFDISERADIKKYLSEMGIGCEDDQLIIQRIVHHSGKGKVYINGTLSTLQALQNTVFPLIEVAGATVPLIEMTGQHENKNLLSRSFQIDVLDRFAGLLPSRKNYLTQYQDYLNIEAEIQEMTQQSPTFFQKLDFLKFQKEEIESAQLKVGEETDLEQKYKQRRHQARLLEIVGFLNDGLSGGTDSITNQLKVLGTKLGEASHLDQTLSPHVEKIAELKNLAESLAFDIEKYADQISGDEDSGSIEERMSLIRKLQKKYGQSTEQILAQLEVISNEISKIETFDVRLEELKKKSSEMKLSLRAQAEDFHKKRIKASKSLGEKVNHELLDLNMKGVQFNIDVKLAENLGPYGISEIEFMIKASKDDLARPLSKIASGGEMSRILLSIKQVTGTSEYPRTYLFDEVDTGVSGPTAEKVGKKLQTISKGQQVICVTHLPQVASWGDAHYLIKKGQSSKGVIMQVTELKKSERVEEIARLISGEKITKTSLAHAEQLLSGR